jgi:hypothetical protein
MEHRLKRIAIALLVLFFSAAVLWRGVARLQAAMTPGKNTPQATLPAGIPTPKPDFRAARQIFPYSIIPGGVRSGREVEDSIVKDPVVARHYAGIDANRLMAERLKHDMDLFSSYRLGNNVYWTKHPIRLRAGELVLTDGVNLIRARCGNRLSSTSSQQSTTDTSAVEPPEIVFEAGTPSLVEFAVDTPIFVEITDESPALTASNRVAPETPGAPTYSSYAPTGYSMIAPPWCCSGPKESIPPPPTPLTPVPEPASLLLLAAGVGVIYKRVIKPRG